MIFTLYFVSNTSRPGDAHALVNKDIIGLGNGLSPVRHQAFTYPDTDIDNSTLRIDFSHNANIFIHENAIENVVLWNVSLASIC